MRLRIIVPPNLESSATRDAIPTKLEIELDDGKIVAPETLSNDAFASLDEAGRVAAFSLFQWCGGKLSSFIQLTKAQLSQLLTNLQGESSFFWANQPKTPIDWNVSELIGVSEHLKSDAREEVQSEAPTPIIEKEPLRDFDGTPMVVDGSSHFLCITLPSREHHYYAEIRELLDSYHFKLEPRNRRWLPQLHGRYQQRSNLFRRHGERGRDERYFAKRRRCPGNNTAQGYRVA